MNERIQELREQASDFAEVAWAKQTQATWETNKDIHTFYDEKFAELIVKEVCGMMEQAEDDAYHCFEPCERPTEYIEWLRDWQERFTKHFGVK